MPFKNISNTKIAVVFSLLVFVTLGILTGIKLVAESRVKAWIQGDSATQLTEIRFWGQQREATCTNSYILSYLNSAAKNARHDSGPGAQTSFHGELKMGRLAAHNIALSVAKDGSCIGIGFPTDLTDGYDYWLIPLGSDSPKALKVLLNFLVDDQFRGQMYDDTRGANDSSLR